MSLTTLQKRFKRKYLKSSNLAILSVVFSLFILLGVNSVIATNYTIASNYTITPTTAMCGVPTDFKVGGLNAGSSYNVTVDGIVEFTNLVADSNGNIAFSYTFNTAGTYSIAIVDNGTTVATFSVTAYDLINMIMPYFIILIMLGVLVGVLGSFTDIFK